MSSLDLHVLGTPPAFVLSQDQTLLFHPVSLSSPAFRPAQDYSRNLLSLFLRFGFCIVFKVRRRFRNRLVHHSTFIHICQAVFENYFTFRHTFVKCKQFVMSHPECSSFIIIEALCSYETFVFWRRLYHRNDEILTDFMPRRFSQRSCPNKFRFAAHHHHRLTRMGRCAMIRLDENICSH